MPAGRPAARPAAAAPHHQAACCKQAALQRAGKRLAGHKQAAQHAGKQEQQAACLHRPHDRRALVHLAGRLPCPVQVLPCAQAHQGGQVAQRVVQRSGDAAVGGVLVHVLPAGCEGQGARSGEVGAGGGLPPASPAARQATALCWPSSNDDNDNIDHASRALAGG